MLVNMLQDSRMPYIKSIIKAIIGVVDLGFSDIMITRDNTLVIIVRDTAIYTVNLTDMEPGLEAYFSYIDIADYVEDSYTNNPFIHNKIASVYNMYKYIENDQSKLLVSESELRGNLEIESIIQLKSTDGARLFKVLGMNNRVYYVPMFSGFPTVNKSDRLGLSIYDIDGINNLNIFHLYKKKINNTINIYFRTINLSL